MDDKEKYMQVQLVKSIEGMNQIENGNLKNFEKIFYNDLNNFHKTKKFYAYKVKDDTMDPKILKNDIIIFERTDSFSNYDTCVVKIANEEFIVRRISRIKGLVLLEPLNREYNTTIYKEEDLNETVKVIGKVVALIRNI